MQNQELTLRKIFIFWVPLAATWLMMASEGPFLAAVIARLADPKYNLAAYGVAFSLGVLVEAPIIMIMSASTALVKDRDSFIRLRNFTYTLNLILTLVMVLILIPSVFDFLALKLIKLPPEVARLTHLATLFLIPWPAMIGFRRFYQGILIRSGLTRRVAYGTVVRLTTMTGTALACFFVGHFDGAVVGTLSLSVGVTVEALASRIMVAGSINKLNSISGLEKGNKPLSYRYITQFYFPLAMTSVLALGVQPFVIFFMGQSRMPLESLAVLPVIYSLVFIFRSVGLSFQEVGIALLGNNNENRKILERFASILAAVVFVTLFVVAFSPLAHIWFQKISGLSLELSRFSLLPTRILALIPVLTVLISYQRAFLVNSGNTKPITVATAIEVSVIVILLLITVQKLHMVGAVSAAIALVIGRLMANAYLFFPVKKLR